MNVIRYRSAFSPLLVLLLTSAILIGQTGFVLASSAAGSVAGEITVTGSAKRGEKPFVLVDGEPAITGRTFFSAGTLTTTESTSASIDFGKVGRINLGPNSTLTLDVTASGIIGTLTKGNITVVNGEGVAVNIDTPHDSITNDGRRASSFMVDVADETRIAAERGLIRYNHGQSTVGAQDDDDDDDDDYWKYWAWAAVIGGVVATILIVRAVNDDDDDVSPVR